MLRIGVIMYQTSPTKGQELVAQRMVEEFRKQGHDAFLITSVFNDWEPVVGPEELQKRGGFVYQFDEPLGIPVIRVNSTLTTWPPRRIAFVDFMAILTQVVDDLRLNVLVTHSTLWNGPEETAKFVEWRRNLSRKGTPDHSVVLCHMSHFQEPSDERYTVVERSYREAWNQVSLSQVIKEADLLLVTTPLEKEQMKQLGAPADKCMLFPGGIEAPAETIGDPGSVFQKFGIPADKKIVTVLGTVEERKNDLAVLEVAKRFSGRRDVHFVMAGKLEGDYGQKVADEAGRVGNLSVTGPVSDEEKAELITGSYLNLTMSRSEALGLAQLEFMFSGVPVVTSGVGGQSWIVRDGSNGVVIDGPDDVEGAVRAISSLIGRPSLRNKLGRKARNSVKDFSMPSLVHRLERRLMRMVEKRPADRLRIGGPRERVLEAMVGKREKVIVTSKRLIVRPVEGDAEPIEVPFEEITAITRQKKFSWGILLLGLVCTLLLFLAVESGLPEIGALPQLLRDSLPTVRSFALPSLALTLVVLAPLLASVAVLVRARIDGYHVHRANAADVHVPREFARLIRLVDKLTPQAILDETPE